MNHRFHQFQANYSNLTNNCCVYTTIPLVEKFYIH